MTISVRAFDNGDGGPQISLRDLFPEGICM